MKINWLKQGVLPPVMGFVVVTLGAEAALRLAGVRQYLLPPPSVVLTTIWREWPVLRADLGQTAEAAAAGFVLSGLVGMLLAVGLSTSRTIERAFYPYAIFFQTVPIVAIAPLLVIWFGYGSSSVIASAFIVSVFPVIANTLSGLVSVDAALRDLFKLYGAKRWATLIKLRLPWALPNVFTGLRVAAGLAVIGTIVGEFIAGRGLGIRIMTAYREQRAELIFAAILLASGLGLALFALVNLVAYWSLRRWHASVASAP